MGAQVKLSLNLAMHLGLNKAQSKAKEYISFPICKHTLLVYLTLS
jgi:hypothetical protein